MNEIIQTIEQVFKEHKLLGNHDFTEDEYSLMLDYVGKLCDNIDKNYYKLIFATLVEIAKRWKQSDNTENGEEDSGYWDYVFKTLYGSDIDQQLCQKYRNAITWLGKNSNIPVVTDGHHFYSSIMMHAFAPKSSIYSFFDLCYIIFKKDFDFGFTKDDEWLCEGIATKIAFFLGHGYSEDKKVSIGSSAYSIKIGLRSFALNEYLSVDFVKFIKETLYQINNLFNKEKIPECTRLERYIVEWWKNKAESEKLPDENVRNNRFSTVSKQNIVAKYIRNDNKVFLCIPSIRLDDDNNTMRLLVYVDVEEFYSEEMITKRGELVVATKQKVFELNNLLKSRDSKNVRIEILENSVIIFDSEKNKATSLNREFILFDGEIEIFSQINKPTNYFVYSKDIDAFRNIPEELSTCGNNLYNIYPKAGECLIGEMKQVFFVDKEKVESLGKNTCLVGNLVNVEWLFDDISCVVYDNNLKLMIPDNLNLKALELRIDRKSYKLQNLKYEILENNCFQFGLKTLGLILENEPIELSLYSYDREETLFKETIIVFSNLVIKFNKTIYYANIEHEITITNGDESKVLSWSNKDNEIIFQLYDGNLIIKIPYLKWRIDTQEWHNENIFRKLWYKDFFNSGTVLEIDYPKDNIESNMFGLINGKQVVIAKNQNGMFEIGRAIYTNENEEKIDVLFDNGKESFYIFTIATKEHFIENPLSFNNGKVHWNIKDTFIGEKENEFLLDVKGNGNNHIRKKIREENIEFNDIGEDIYRIIVKIRDKNIFIREENYNTIFEGKLIVGSLEKLRFKNKKIRLLKANCFNAKNEWIQFIPEYFIDKLQFVEAEESIYYSGRLCVIDLNREIRVLSTMLNEKNSYDKINPIRIELRDNSTLWLVAGWEGENDFLGNLFFDKKRKGICNIAQQNNLYNEINLYKFKEEEYV